LAAADEGKRELKGAKAVSGSVRRASFENLMLYKF
jgi:hypothetical protein